MDNQQPPPPLLPYLRAPFCQLLKRRNQHQLQIFWTFQRQGLKHVKNFKNHHLPLARIKKIMKADEDVRMISAEAPVLFAKACELFILELTIRSWLHAEENKRKTIQKSDIAAAVSQTDILDFLMDIIPTDENKGERLQNINAAEVSDILGTPCYNPQTYQGYADTVFAQPTVPRFNPDAYFQQPLNPW